MLRVEGPDGRPLETVTIICDQDDAHFLLGLFSDLTPELEALARPGGNGEFAIQLATSTPSDPGTTSAPKS